MADSGQPDLVPIYDSLWREGEAAFAHNAVKLDPHLANKDADRRRGLTVILRPETEARREMEAFMAELRQMEPRQHYYKPSELHVTVLSLLTCAEDYQPSSAHLERYAEAVTEAMRGVGPFSIRFDGVTATAEAVMIQGFPDEELALLRTRIFEQLAARGLPQRQRYVPKTAHITLMRFANPPGDLPRFADKIRASRSRPFGSTSVTQIELVENNWYMSEYKTRIIATYALRRHE
jgi:2'-5' RNA ligase